MVQYNNPNPQGKKVSNMMFGPTQDQILNVDPATLADITPAEYGTLGMGQPGRINFGPDARSAFYRPVPKAMDDWLTPITKVVSAGVRALETEDQNSLNRYQTEITDLQKAALDTSKPSDLHSLNEEGVYEPNWDAVADRIEGLNKKYSSMYTIKGNLSISSLGLKNRTENALKQGRNLENLWNKEFVKLKTDGYSATEIADEFDKWFGEIDDPYVHQALEKWKETTLVNYQSAILQEQDAAFASGLAAAEKALAAEFSNPVTWKQLFDPETGQYSLQKAQDLASNLLVTFLEENPGIAIPPASDGTSGMEMLLNENSPRSRIFRDSRNRIASFAHNAAVQNRKAQSVGLLAQASERAKTQGTSAAGDKKQEIRTIAAHGTEAENPTLVLDTVRDSLTNWQISYMDNAGYSVDSAASLLALNAYANWQMNREEASLDTILERFTPEARETIKELNRVFPANYTPEQQLLMDDFNRAFPESSFGTLESFEAFQEEVAADRLNLDDVDNNWVAGPGEYDAGGLVTHLRTMDPKNWLKAYNKFYADGAFEEIRTVIERNLPDGLSRAERIQETNALLATALGTAINRTNNKRASGTGGGRRSSDDHPITESAEFITTKRNHNSGAVQADSVQKYLAAVPHPETVWTLDNFQDQNIQLYYLATTELLDALGEDGVTDQAIVQKMDEIRNAVDDGTIGMLVAQSLERNTSRTPEGEVFLTEEGVKRQKAFDKLLLLDPTDSLQSNVSSDVAANRISRPIQSWINTPLSEGNSQQRTDQMVYALELLHAMGPNQRNEYFNTIGDGMRPLVKLMYRTSRIEDANGNPYVDIAAQGWTDNPEAFRQRMKVFLERREDPSLTSRSFTGQYFGFASAAEIQLNVDNNHAAFLGGENPLSDVLDPDNAYYRKREDPGFVRAAYTSELGPEMQAEEDDLLRSEGGLVGGTFKTEQWARTLYKSLRDSLQERYSIADDDPVLDSIVQDLTFAIEKDEFLKEDVMLFMILSNAEAVTEADIAAWTQGFTDYILDDVTYESVGTPDRPRVEFRQGNSKFGLPNSAEEPSTVSYSNIIPKLRLDDQAVFDRNNINFTESYTGQSTAELGIVAAELNTAWSNLPEPDRLKDLTEFNRGLVVNGIPEEAHEAVHNWVRSHMEAIENAGHTVLIGDVKWARLLAYAKFNGPQGADGNVDAYIKLLEDEVSSGRFEYMDGHMYTSEEDPLISYWRMNEEFANGQGLQAGPRWFGLPLVRGTSNQLAQNRGYLGIGYDWESTTLLEGKPNTAARTTIGNIPEGIFSVGMYKYRNGEYGKRGWRLSPHSGTDIVGGGIAIDSQRELLQEFIVTNSNARGAITSLVGSERDGEVIHRNARTHPQIADAFIKQYYEDKKLYDPQIRLTRAAMGQRYYADRFGNDVGADYARENERRGTRIKTIERILKEQAKERVNREHHTGPFIEDVRGKEGSLSAMRNVDLDPVSLGLQEGRDWDRGSVIAGLRREGSLNVQLQYALNVPASNYVTRPTDIDEVSAPPEAFNNFKAWWSSTDKTIPLATMREGLGMSVTEQEAQFNYYGNVYDGLTDLERDTLSTRVGVENKRNFVASMMYANFFDKSTTLGQNVYTTMARKRGNKILRAQTRGDILTYRLPSEGQASRSMESPAYRAKRRRFQYNQRMQGELLNMPDNLKRIMLRTGLRSNEDYPAWWKTIASNDQVRALEAWAGDDDPRRRELINQWFQFRNEARDGFGATDWDWEESLDRFFKWKKTQE